MTETRPPARWRRAPVTMGLIVACVLVWLVQLVVPTSTDALLLSADTGWSQPWRFVTAMFTHDPVLPFGFMHIGFNLFALYTLGRSLEPFLGSGRFLLLHLWSGLAGGVAFVLLMPNPGGTMPWGGAWTLGTVGASGAVFGLFGAIFIAQRAVGGSTSQILVVLGINLLITFGISGIAWQAHLGGLAAGVALAWHLLHRPRAPRRWPAALTLMALLVVVRYTVMV
ncbi:rhomboid family intramembrane serine protease [Aestuariimicrobium sp. T2.26MG-19.2B]|uniref:rhomboid family intramembrane serine protease n=1 Tax=Aestuariimicrobium sp. T2.26MG-19.2B TaxID=3040679 RepID=UPI00247770D0|nr:rhomboid family intramembrane serine protease [Aestuariimicrobium sp. T2.26MG-19.2B]CAI9409006.1 Rhomboid protease GlpG [Aestuariimicrobium sp. T2.26MG-19.2B]